MPGHPATQAQRLKKSLAPPCNDVAMTAALVNRTELFAVGDAGSKGCGLFATSHIPEGVPILEYVGRVTKGLHLGIHAGREGQPILLPEQAKVVLILDDSGRRHPRVESSRKSRVEGPGLLGVLAGKASCDASSEALDAQRAGKKGRRRRRVQGRISRFTKIRNQSGQKGEKAHEAGMQDGRLDSLVNSRVKVGP
eukprot:scaffold247_cov274-Pinguiococcus_pyrenoidosus.AAC.24